MARSKFTLDAAALELVQLEPDDRAGAKRLRDRVRRLARSASIVDAARPAAQGAAAALGLVARGAGEPAEALAEAGRRLEQALRIADEHADAPAADRAGVGAAADTAVGPARPDVGGIDPLMAAALAAFDLEDEASGAPPVAGSDVAGARAPTWSADAEPELLESFVAESLEYLANAEAALLELEADPTRVEPVNRVFRCFHTIKGTSAFLGLTRVSELAHGAETLMSRVRDREIVLEGGYAELALGSVDVLSALVDAVGAALAGRPAAEPEACAALLAALADPEAAARGGLAPVLAAAVGTTEVRGTTGSEAADAWMRLRTDRLDRLVDTIGELVIAHSMVAQDDSVALPGHETLARKVGHASKIVRELQDLSISMRMIPLKGVTRKLARVARDAAARSGKQVELVTEGADTEVDRNIADVIADPLVHMVRNAIDHGIEPPAERAAAGKPPCGTIRVVARHAGGGVVLTLSDDGRGLDRTRIAEKAATQGLIEKDRGVRDRELFDLIFAPGFSTAETVTDLSGRGVGMDVVRRSVEALHGRIDIDSEPGTGVRFTIRLPLTLAITEGMLVRLGAERYILPVANIELSFRPAAAALSTVQGRGELVLLRGDVLPVVRLHRLLGVDDAETDATRGLLVVVGSGERRCALLVDELLGQHQLVAKSLGDGIGRVPGISGGAILGDGRVGLILDVAEVLSLSPRPHVETRAA